MEVWKIVAATFIERVINGRYVNLLKKLFRKYIFGLQLVYIVVNCYLSF